MLNPQDIENIKKINLIAKDISCPKTYIVGGIPREMIMGLKDGGSPDIDLTNNSSSITRLAIQSAKDLELDFKISNRKDKNQPGNISLYGRGLKLDFSSNFISNYVKNNFDFKNKDKYETYSRDFTVNSVHRDVEKESFLDLTKRGIDDIQNNYLSCIIKESACFSEQPQRIFRCLKFATKYDMKVDYKIEKFLNDEKSDILKSKVDVRYISKIVNFCMNLNPNLCLDNIYKLNLSSYIPINGELKRFLISEKRLVEFMDKQNLRDRHYE